MGTTTSAREPFDRAMLSKKVPKARGRRIDLVSEHYQVDGPPTLSEIGLSKIQPADY
jgi:hypothetical protein